MINDTFTEVFLKITLHRLCDLYLNKLKYAIVPLKQEQLWHEAYPNSNSIGGIMLHVCEHINRSSLRLTNQQELLKEGFELYFPNLELTPEQVLHRMEIELDAWRSIMNRYLNEELTFTVEHIHELSHLVEHAGYHIGQVIDRIQAQTGVHFEFYKKGLNERFLRDKIEGNL
ncbi:MAG: hypothetical protein K6T85_09900 [Gorillibacterium sp.]|nr:hypothetical protein [Gorillibacterium sp.]